MNFEKVEKKVTDLSRQKKYAEAIQEYEKILGQYPDKVFEITFALAQFYKATGNLEKAVDTFEYGLQRKVIYPIWQNAPYWQPLVQMERFKMFLAENDRLRAELTARTEPEFKIVTPKKYSPDKKYPILLVLHGWNESLEQPAKSWTSARIEREFILVFVQSSQVVSPHTYGWEDILLGRKDIKKLHEQLAKIHQIDEQKVIISGFSQGGMMALDIAVNQVIPVAGFIVLHPGGGVPKEVTIEKAKNVVGHGLRGTILINEQEKTQPDPVTLINIFQEAGLPCRVAASLSGHGYPPDFPGQLDEALSDIVDKIK